MTFDGRRTGPSRRFARGPNGARFDGNFTDDLPSAGNWLFLDDALDEKHEEIFDILMEYAVGGNLRWVVVPLEGYRL